MLDSFDNIDNDENALPAEPRAEARPNHARAYLALGSNQGDRLGHLRRGLEGVRRFPETEVRACSPVFESEPAYYTEQAPFANAVLELRTALEPRALLAELQRLELEEGRVRSFPNAPRPLDMDILDYEGVCLGDEDLTLPHPRLLERDFVVTPLLAIAPCCVLANGKRVTREHIAYGEVLGCLAEPDVWI